MVQGWPRGVGQHKAQRQRRQRRAQRWGKAGHQVIKGDAAQPQADGQGVGTVVGLRRIQPQWKTSILEVRYREQSDALKQALLNVSENLARL